MLLTDEPTGNKTVVVGGQQDSGPPDAGFTLWTFLAPFACVTFKTVSAPLLTVLVEPTGNLQYVLSTTVLRLLVVFMNTSAGERRLSQDKASKRTQ